MRRVLAGLAACLALAGCAGLAESVSYELVEFSITGPDQLGPGSTSLTVSNAGEFPHTMVVTDSSGEVVAATSLVQPEQSVELAVDLRPGRYSFTCRIVAQDSEGQLIDHFESGMAATVEVSG
ncbi:MAG TPA: hypothetical protein VJ948_10845 [Acidimicrobiia bacterium]|nr:hypothetical protein [Acidimicrobiia bacterium]